MTASSIPNIGERSAEQVPFQGNFQLRTISSREWEFDKYSREKEKNLRHSKGCLKIDRRKSRNIGQN